MLDQETTAARLMELFILFSKTHWAPPRVGDLTPGESSMLMHLHRMQAGRCHGVPSAHGARVKEISRMLRVAPPSVTQQVNTLETRGYLIREMDPRDPAGGARAPYRQGRTSGTGHGGGLPGEDRQPDYLLRRRKKRAAHRTFTGSIRILQVPGRESSTRGSITRKEG